ncbi:hypothetical protein D9M70_452770 [compost metagenome]
MERRQTFKEPSGDWFTEDHLVSIGQVTPADQDLQELTHLDLLGTQATDDWVVDQGRIFHQDRGGPVVSPTDGQLVRLNVGTHFLDRRVQVQLEQVERVDGYVPFFKEDAQDVVDLVRDILHFSPDLFTVIAEIVTVTRGRVEVDVVQVTYDVRKDLRNRIGTREIIPHVVTLIQW